MALNIKLLSEICKAPGAPGYESLIRNLVHKKVEKSVDTIDIDNIGNLIAIKKGKSSKKKVVVAAHMDEIGFMVKHIDDNGFIKFQNLGGFDPKTHTAQRVIVHGKKDLVGVMASKPIHIMSVDERSKMPKSTDYFVDLGMPVKEVKKLVEIGNPITRERELIEMGNCVNAKSIDNRVSVFILIEALKKIKKPAYDVYAAFTVQEEVGLRGADVAAQHINADFAINLDVTIAYDLPGAKPEEVTTKLGEGTAIKILDGQTICDPRMIEFLKQSADKKKIKWQPELLSAGGTDTASLQRRGDRGSIAGAISIPTRNLHQVIEMANKDDIQATIDLLVVALNDLDEFDWNPR